ncbi:DUF3800 domain-containing protein [Arthrobacter castelli]|uniref:DUF3800 domain-containing protein n=1 Tax=Arthrobacter castelli TaxID=271431 RepID=UPI00047D1607|nr:DUF3800 domain-containing protein [Arthrobacter castelli]
MLALSLAVDGILSGVAGVSADVEFHGTEMFRGKGAWLHVPVEVRVRAFEMSVALLAEHNCVIAHSSIDKTKLSVTDSVATSPHLMAFQLLVEKINSFAKRQRDPLLQRVLLVADETTEHDAFAINLVAGMQRQETIGVGAYGAIRNVVDTVHFVRCETNRGVQLADLVIYGLHRVARMGPTPNRGDQEMRRILAEHVSPLIRTYRDRWPP